jgi:hypothetical protein
VRRQQQRRGEGGAPAARHPPARGAARAHRGRRR